MRSISRVCDVSINTVSKLLVDAGIACASFHHETMQHVKAKRVRCDEIWSFCYSKQSNTLVEASRLGRSDVWTWTAIDADSKLMVSWMVGDRDATSASIFIDDLRARLAERVQLTTDGHKVYLTAIRGAFGDDVDYAMPVKLCSESPDGEKRYSPARCTGIRTDVVTGKPDDAHISPSYMERHNLTMRMPMRRFTRLTNAFSKKIDNHCHALALYFVWYNFARLHKAHRVTPAMAAGLTDKVMDMADIVRLVDVQESERKRR
jgi:IS1 family transposase